MTTTATPDTAAAPAPASLSPGQIAELLRSLVLREAAAAQIAAANKAHREAVQAHVLDLYKQAGTKTLTVNDEHGNQLATVSVSDTNPVARVTNEDAFTEWVETHLGPDSIQTIIQVHPATKTGLLKDPVTDDEGHVLWINKDTGETVPIAGVTYQEGVKGTGISVGKKKADAIETALSLLGTDDALKAVAPMNVEGEVA